MDYEIVGDPEIGSYGLKNNLVLKINGAEFPIGKDYMIYEGEMIQLPGLTVYAPATEKVYVSKEALEIIGLL
jgi:alkaline phosphatase